MARPKGIDYRKLAFEVYAPICVFCGFGIEAVLEVAHLDYDTANCELHNLVLLCPTCLRMHEIDLIPTEVVVRLRDQKRKPNWRKLLKDAGEKAAATKHQTPGLLCEASLKAVATRHERNAARANAPASPIRGRSVPEIVWTPVPRLPTNLGHGVQFLVRSANGRRLVAWLEEFEWLHSKPERVEILITDDEALLPASRAKKLKAAVETRIRAHELITGRVCEGVEALING